MNSWRQDSKGRWHRVIWQTRIDSCAMACAAMLASAYASKLVSEETMLASPQGMQGYSSGGGTKSLENVAAILERRDVDSIFQWVPPNGMLNVIAPLLSTKRLAMAQVNPMPGAPMGHLVVIGMVYPDDTVIIIDPGMGIQEQKRSDFPNYFAGETTFSGWYLQTV